MSKPLKSMLMSYLKNRYDGVDSACVVDLTGLNVADTEKLREKIRESNGRVEIVKNSLARRAFADTPLKSLGESLTGPCALVTADDSIIDVAKKLVDFAKEFKQVQLKDAVLDGDEVLMSVHDLSKMKSRFEILGDVAGLIWGPGRRLASAIGSPQAKVAGCLKAIADK